MSGDISDGDDISDAEYNAMMAIAALKTAAVGFYENQEPNAQPEAGFFDNLIYRKPESGLVPFVVSPFIQDAAAWLAHLNIVETALYRQGTSAAILVGRTDGGKKCAIRIPMKFSDPEAHDRGNHPAILQPLHTLGYMHGTNIEVLPLGPFIDFSDVDNKSIKSHLNAYLRIACDHFGLHVAEGLKDDLILLPDGTPVFADPGSARALKRLMPLKGISNSVDSFYRLRPHWKRISWWQDGQSKQSVYFNEAYLAAPAPRDGQEIVKKKADSGLPKPVR